MDLVPKIRSRLTKDWDRLRIRSRTLESEFARCDIDDMGVPTRKNEEICSRITVTCESSVYTVNRQDGFEQYHMDDSCDLYR